MSKDALADICIWLGVLLIAMHVVITLLAAFRPSALGVLNNGPIATLIEKAPNLGAGVLLIALGAVLNGWLDASIAFGDSTPTPTPSPT